MVSETQMHFCEKCPTAALQRLRGWAGDRIPSRGDQPFRSPHRAAAEVPSIKDASASPVTSDRSGPRGCGQAEGESPAAAVSQTGLLTEDDDQ